MKFKAIVEIETDDRFHYDGECIETMIRGRINGGAMGVIGVVAKAKEVEKSK